MCLLLLKHSPTLLPRRVQLKKSTSRLMTRMMSSTGSPFATIWSRAAPTPTRPAQAVPILSAAPIPRTSAIAERPAPDSPAKRKGKATAGRSFGRDIPSSPEEEAEQRPAKRERRYHVITADSDDDSSAELPEAVLGLHHMKKRYLHFKKCMIQGPCETLWYDFFLKIF
ncbi:hypothetical protein GQ457_04G018630 [Hibiscus cannabinus]